MKNHEKYLAKEKMLNERVNKAATQHAQTSHKSKSIKENALPPPKTPHAQHKNKDINNKKPTTTTTSKPQKNKSRL